MDNRAEKSRSYRDLCVFTDEQMGSLSREKSSKLPHEHEKRARREIANSNERRRMQSINVGFQQIKSLLPLSEEEKLSKSAILQQAVEYIGKLEEEKKHISLQNEQLLRMLQTFEKETQGIHLLKRKKWDESLTHDVLLAVDYPPESESDSGSSILTQLQHLVASLRAQLECERHLRLAVEQKVDNLKAHLKMERLTTAEEKQVSLDVKFPLSETAAESCQNSNPIPLSGPLGDRSVSRRNLETIVKAIYHVEGGNVLADKTQESNRISENKLEEPMMMIDNSNQCYTQMISLYSPLADPSATGNQTQMVLGNSNSSVKLPTTVTFAVVKTVPIGVQTSTSNHLMIRPVSVPKKS